MPLRLLFSTLSSRPAMRKRRSSLAGLEAFESRCLLSAHALHAPVEAEVSVHKGTHAKESKPIPNFAGNWYIYKDNVQFSSIVFEQDGKHVTSQTNNAFSYVFSGKVKGDTLTLHGQIDNGAEGPKTKVTWTASFTNSQHFTGTFSEVTGKTTASGQLDGDISII